MRRDDDGGARLAEPEEERDDPLVRSPVQVPGRLVGEDESWSGRQDPGDGDPLLFAPG